MRLSHHRSRIGFTLIELILVMAILAIAVMYTAPALARFFRGRSLDSEARRLLALTREAQSRSISEGVPVDLWIDINTRTFGVEAEPSYEDQDSRAIEITMEADLQLELGQISARDKEQPTGMNPLPADEPVEDQEAQTIVVKHPDLPRMRFMPDGSIDSQSPGSLRLIARDGTHATLAQSRNRRNYEISRAE